MRGGDTSMFWQKEPGLGPFLWCLTGQSGPDMDQLLYTTATFDPVAILKIWQQ